MSKNIKKVKVTDFRAKLSHYLELLKRGERIEVRGIILGKIEDVHEKSEDVQMHVQIPVQIEDKPVAKSSVVDQLRAQVKQIENRGKVQFDSLPPEPEIWHKEELEEEEGEEEHLPQCELCKCENAERTVFDAGDRGEVDICLRCAKGRYAGSMKFFDKYWNGLQKINNY